MPAGLGIHTKVICVPADFRFVMMFNISVISEPDSHLKLEMTCIDDLESVKIVMSGQSSG